MVTNNYFCISEFKLSTRSFTFCLYCFDCSLFALATALVLGMQPESIQFEMRHF